MAHNQQEHHYIIAHEATRTTPTDGVEALVKQFRSLEDILLLWSIPALIGSLLLLAMSIALKTQIPFIPFVLSLLVTATTLVTACILFLKWIDTLQYWGRAFAQATDEKTIRRFFGVSAVCLLLLILIIATATAENSGQEEALQMLIFILLGWHYRSLLQRFSKE